MKSSKLVTYLTEIGRYELRIQIAREILARNMNFSPAWLLAAMRQKQDADDADNNLTISRLRLLFQLIGFNCQNSQAVLLFEYFDKDGKGLVKKEDFIQFLLPVIKQGLRKAVIKRPPEDVQLTFELKHGLRRIFTQIIKAKSELKLYDGEFGPHIHRYCESPVPTKEQISKFLKQFGKYPTDSEVALITSFIMQGKTKQIPVNQICSIIEDSSKEVEYLAHNPAVLNQKTDNQLINLKVKELERAKEIGKILEKGELEHALNSRMFGRLGTFGAQENEEKPTHRRVEVDRNEMIQTPMTARMNQTPHSSSDSSLKAQLSQQSPLPNLKIQRTNSIIQNQQKYLSNQELKRAEKLADKLLTNPNTQKERENQKDETPFRKLEQSQPSPAVYYPSRRKQPSQPSQQSLSDYHQLLNTNLELEEQIHQHKLENRARIKEAKDYLRYDAAY